MARSPFLSAEELVRRNATAVADDAAERIEVAQNTDPDNDPGKAPTLSEDATPQAEVVAFPSVTQEDYDRVAQERDQLLDRLARLQAEFDNARKREQRERAEVYDRAVGAAIAPLLPALDNFHLALGATGTPEQFRAGVELIARQLEEALRSLGVVAVDTVGTQFDPHMHEALGSVETNEVPDHQIVEEVRRGYKMKDKLLRPALVRVANNTTQQEA
jgi:molecular chaperone GrpE